jgi:Mg-chelatase subunit ChlD
MTTWIKKQFDAAGLTQSPPGPGLGALQARMSGTVMLCIDVSGSMSARDAKGPDGTPMQRLDCAVAGARGFVAEALAGNYRVGVVGWHHGIQSLDEPTKDAREIEKYLNRLSITGGNNIVPTLDACEQILAPLKGDRVVAIFGDGDLGSPTPAATTAKRLELQGIRIITMGLGEASARAMAAISTEDVVLTASTATMADDIKSMSGRLKRT